MFRGASQFNSPLSGPPAAERRRMTEESQPPASPPPAFASAPFTPGPFGWCMAFVTSLDSMFRGCAVFNQELNTWDTSRVTSMRHTFADTARFDQELNAWNTSRVTTMDELFLDASAFNGALHAWDASSVKSMVGTFRNAVSFNRDIDSWSVSAVTDMQAMFQGPTVAPAWKMSYFNQPLNAWNVGQVTSFFRMFRAHNGFDQPLHAWDVGQVTNFSEMWDSHNDPNRLGELIPALTECNKHHIGKRWGVNPYWHASAYGGWDTEYTCESPPPLPPPLPPTIPPATPDWAGEQYSIWFCSVHLWPESAKRRPEHRSHSGLDYSRDHAEAEQRWGYEHLPIGLRNLPTVISGCCQCMCNPSNTPDSRGRSCKVPNRPDGTPPSAGVIVNPSGTCRCPMCDVCNNITWAKEQEYCGHGTLNRGRWVKLSVGETCDAPCLGPAGRCLSELKEEL